jgi:hypothetical protein
VNNTSKRGEDELIKKKKIKNYYTWIRLSGFMFLRRFYWKKIQMYAVKFVKDNNKYSISLYL